MPVSYTHLDVYKRQVLGRAGKTLGVKFATPIFDGATMEDLDQWTDLSLIHIYYQYFSR